MTSFCIINSEHISHLFLNNVRWDITLGKRWYKSEFHNQVYKYISCHRSFSIPLKKSENQKGFLMFPGDTERDHWHEMG